MRDVMRRPCRSLVVCGLVVAGHAVARGLAGALSGKYRAPAVAAPGLWWPGTPQEVVSRSPQVGLAPLAGSPAAPDIVRHGRLPSGSRPAVQPAGPRVSRSSYWSRRVQADAKIPPPPGSRAPPCENF